MAPLFSRTPFEQHQNSTVQRGKLTSNQHRCHYPTWVGHAQYMRKSGHIGHVKTVLRLAPLVTLVFILSVDASTPRNVSKRPTLGCDPPPYRKLLLKMFRFYFPQGGLGGGGFPQPGELWRQNTVISLITGLVLTPCLFIFALCFALNTYLCHV